VNPTDLARYLDRHQPARYRALLSTPDRGRAHLRRLADRIEQEIHEVEQQVLATLPDVDPDDLLGRVRRANQARAAATEVVLAEHLAAPEDQDGPQDQLLEDTTYL